MSTQPTPPLPWPSLRPPPAGSALARIVGTPIGSFAAPTRKAGNESGGSRGGCGDAGALDRRDFLIAELSRRLHPGIEHNRRSLIRSVVCRRSTRRGGGG